MTVTAVLGVAVAVFMTISLLRIKPEEIERLFPVKEEKQDPAEIAE